MTTASPIKRGKGVFGDPESERTFQTPYGAFTLRRPSIASQIAIHKQVARDLEGLTNIDTMGETWMLWVATLTVCARSDNQRPAETPAGFPEGFAWDQAFEAEWLPELFDEFNKWVQSFRKSKQSDADQEGGVGGSADGEVRPPDEVRPDAERPTVPIAD